MDLFAVGLNRTGDIAGAQAPSTDVYMARSTIDNCLNALHIGLPGPIGTSVRMGHLDTKGHAFAAKIALSHLTAPPRRYKLKVLTALSVG